MWRKLTKRMCFFGVPAIALLWGWYCYQQNLTLSAWSDQVSLQKLLTFARSIDDARKRGERLPSRESDVWEFIGHGAAITPYLQFVFCEPRDANPFTYRRISDKSFAVGFTGNRGMIEVIYSEGAFKCEGRGARGLLVRPG